MHAEVMAIGDELTSGQRLDTNTQWLSQQLGDLGITVRYHTTVADDLDGIYDFTLSDSETPESDGSQAFYGWLRDRFSDSLVDLTLTTNHRANTC